MPEYQRFGDFAEEVSPLDGDKIKIEAVLNREVLVTGFKVTTSKYKENSQRCMTLQVEVDGSRRVVFTGSSVMIEQVERYKGHIPFLTVIKKIDRYYTLS
jgi:hypothetical protein